MKHKPAKTYANTPITRENDRQAKSWRNYLKKVMEEQNLSQRKLAELAGLGATSVRHAVQKDGTITIETLRRLANATGKSLAYFMAGEDHPPIVAVLIHAPHEEPGVDHGRGRVFVEKVEECVLFGLEMTDNSMMGIGSNFQPDLHDLVVPGDVVIWNPDLEVETGDLIVVDLGQFERPRYCVRLLEKEDGDYYAAALTRSHGRDKIRPELAGRVVSVVRRRTR